MRTLVSINDIQQEVNKPLFCPRCGTSAQELPTVECHLQMTGKGEVLVSKKAVCEVHGYFSIIKHIKAVQMYGSDAQVIPAYE